MTDETLPPAPETIDLGRGAWILPGDLRYTFVRATGPGGQSVNKVSSAAQLRVAVTAIGGLDDAARDRLRRLAGQRLTGADEILITAHTHRSQVDNRRACLTRLRDVVERALTPRRPRRPRRVTRAMIERRLADKKRRSEKKGRRRWKEE